MSLFQTDRRDEKLPVFVLTGFLGSGKTTLLNRLLREPAVADSAVIVNEIGEVGLDHLLVERIDGQVALLRSGCICCAMRSDFEATLRELLARRDEGTLPPFARVVIETTGLADPAPLVQTVDSNPLVAHFCSLGAVLVTVDAVNAPLQLQRQWEARKQVALADELLLTKTDLAADTAQLEEVLRGLNPHANLRRIGAGPVPIDLLRPHAMQRDIDRAVGLLAGRALAPLHGDVVSFVVQAERPLDWPRLQQWLADLRTRHGDRLLRLKAIVSVAGEPDPLVLHGVHHLFHPPVRKPGLDWPAERSALVVIARGLDQTLLEQGFAACAA